MDPGQAYALLAPRFLENIDWAVNEDHVAYVRLTRVLSQVHDWSDDRLAPNCGLLLLRSSLRRDPVAGGTYLAQGTLSNTLGGDARQAVDTYVHNIMQRCYSSGKLVYGEDILSCVGVTP
jgi:hypothetical protein